MDDFMQLPCRIQAELQQNFDKQYPPNPLLPKTFMKMDDSPKFGGLTKFIKLMRFKGQDDGKSKFRQEAAMVEHIEFPEGTTIMKIFKPLEKKSVSIFDSGVSQKPNSSRPDSHLSQKE